MGAITAAVLEAVRPAPVSEASRDESQGEASLRRLIPQTVDRKHWARSTEILKRAAVDGGGGGTGDCGYGTSRISVQLAQCARLRVLDPVPRALDLLRLATSWFQSEIRPAARLRMSSLIWRQPFKESRREARFLIGTMEVRFRIGLRQERRPRLYRLGRPVTTRSTSIQHPESRDPVRSES